MNETKAGSSGAPDGGGRHQGSAGNSSPFQARAAFLANWDWQSVVRINLGACERGRAQHGIGSETGTACEESWQLDCANEQTLAEALHLLRSYHRRAPFLFFNGNTFAAIARQLAEALFHELPVVRRREVISALAHYVAGVLDRESMVSIVDSLCEAASFLPGDRVRTLRGSTCGVVVRVLDDGRIAWRPDSSALELIGLPESLRKL
jgi:hypothetical protein